MPLPSAPPCEHDLRPGTAVCLRCQHAERAAKRARQRRLIARGSAVALSAAVLAVVGIAAAAAFKGRVPGASARRPPFMAARTDTVGDSAARLATDAPTDPESGTGAALASSPDSSLVGPPQPGLASQSLMARPSAPPAPVASLGAGGGLSPIIPQGRTALRDTMVAVRSGDTVRVSFDLQRARTRRPEKFEWIVRSTLPQVYGAAADSALRALPEGLVARAGDLIAELPARGLRIPLADGRALALWPETRPGRDGPIVVAYRAVAPR